MHKIKKLFSLLFIFVFCVPNINFAAINYYSNSAKSLSSTSLEKNFSATGHELALYINTIVNKINYSVYKWGGSYVDSIKGIYILDCSAFVDYVIKQIYPKAYAHLTKITGSGKPTSQNYYSFFTNLSKQRISEWSAIKKVEELRPGDLLVFRYRDHETQTIKGHVVVIMNKPFKKANTYHVRVADSSPYRHSNDTRMLHDTGIGIGTMLLKANAKTGQPIAYAWSLSSRLWHKDVKFAMARLTAMA